MMKKGFGLAEILLCIVIITLIYLWSNCNKYGRSNPFADNSEVKTRQEIINDNVQNIESSKALKQRIENNLKEGN